MQFATADQLRELLVKLDEIDVILQTISEIDTYQSFDGQFIKPLRAFAIEALRYRESRLTPVATEAASVPASDVDGDTRRPAEHDG